MMNENKIIKYRNIINVMESDHKDANSKTSKEFKKDQVIYIPKNDFEKMQYEMLEFFNDHLELQKQNMQLLLLINEVKSNLLKDIKFN